MVLEWVPPRDTISPCPTPSVRPATSLPQFPLLSQGGRARMGWVDRCPGDVTASPAAPGLGRSWGSGNTAHTSQPDLPAPKNRKCQTCSGSSAPGDAPRLRAPPDPRGLGEQSRVPPPARLRPDKLIA